MVMRQRDIEEEYNHWTEQLRRAEYDDDEHGIQQAEAALRELDCETGR